MCVREAFIGCCSRSVLVLTGKESRYSKEAAREGGREGTRGSDPRLFSSDAAGRVRVVFFDDVIKSLPALSRRKFRKEAYERVSGLSLCASLPFFLSCFLPPLLLFLTLCRL